MRQLLFLILFLFVVPILDAQTTLVDSYSESNYTANMDVYDISFTAVGQSFIGNGGDLTSAKFYLNRLGTGTGNCHAYLFAHTGTYGTSGVPTGFALATSDAVDVTTIIKDAAKRLVTFTFSHPYTLVSGTNYIIMFGWTGANTDIQIGYDNVTHSHSGNLSYYYGDWYYYFNPPRDCIFYVYSTTPPPAGGGGGQIIIVGE
jgi:hypothetical protein